MQSEGADVRIAINWTDKEGAEHDIAYGGLIDGSKQPIDNSGSTTVSYLRVDENTLDSTVYCNDEKTAYSRRIVSDANDLLVVVMVEYGAEGNFSNFQVYRRDSE